MLEKLKLKNWKCHSSLDLEFKPGVNVIVGPMGAGKSSILQAISYALFGTFSELKSRDVKLADLHKHPNTNQTKIELSFEKEIPIRISRTIENGKSSEATARSPTKLLAGTNPAQVNDFVQSVIKIDEDTFLQTTYAKQNEIDLYLNLSPGERKQRLDNLMGLNKFEVARKYSVKLKNNLQTKKESKEEIIQQADINQILNQIIEIETEIKKLEIRKHKSATNLATLEEQKDQLQITLKKLDKQKQEITQLKERQHSLTSQLNEVEAKLKKQDLPDEKEIENKHKELQSKINELRSSKSELTEELDNNQNKLLKIENKIGALENKDNEAKEVLKKIKLAKEKLKLLQEFGQLEIIQTKIYGLEKRIEKEKEIIQNSKGTLTTLEKNLKELRDSKDLCPVCSSKLDEEIKTQLIHDRELDISQLKELIESKTIEVTKVQDLLFQLKENQEEQKEILATIKDESETHEKEKLAIAELSEAKGQKMSLSEITISLKTKIKRFETNLEQYTSELQELDRQKQFLEIKNKKTELENQLINIDNLLSKIQFDQKQIEQTEKNFHKTIQEIEKIRAEAKTVTLLVKEKEIRMQELRKRKKNITDIQEQVNTLAEKISFLEQFKNSLIFTQEALRKELILAINELMDGIWQKLYPYNSLNSIRLNATENDYILEFKSNQEWLSVAGYASGGERTLTSLALRMAIAKVMAPNLSLLILDEPTHNLDSEAINTLISVLRENMSDFLDQIFVVTHDDKLAEAGDYIIELKKD